MTATAIEGVPICGAAASECRCSLPPGHDSPVHECGRSDCGGRWTGDYDAADFSVVRLPRLPWSP